MNRKMILYIAMSLDGYIADKQGNVDWLKGDDVNDHSDTSYQELLEEIDTIIMGYSTYHQLITELSPNEWPYPGVTTYVLTHRECVDVEGIHFVNAPMMTLVDTLQKQDGKAIWVCGGSTIVSQLVAENAIDEYRIFIIPTILGDGIPCFKQIQQKTDLKCESVRLVNGMVNCNYKKRMEETQ